MRARTLILGMLLGACARAPEASLSTMREMAAMNHRSASEKRTELSALARRQLAELRQATARFRDQSVAAAAGYRSSLTECMTDGVKGGMGYHYGDLSKFDGSVTHDAPEILVYEPQKDGTLRFVAVEFAIPFGRWTSDVPPSLFGQQFHRNVRFGLWVLHAWIGRENPNGLFTDYNPNVTCPDA